MAWRGRPGSRRANRRLATPRWSSGATATACYINTSGIGVIADGIAHRAATRAGPGDVVIVSGTIGDHGMAIMSVREGLEFETDDRQRLRAAATGWWLRCSPSRANVHVLRDPTRGGLASSLNEIASASNVGIVIREAALPVLPQVQSACEILGLDPVFVANEGKLLAIVPPRHADALLAAMRAHPRGANAALIGEVTAAHPGMLVARTAIGAQRVIAMQIGEQLPRIC